MGTRHLIAVAHQGQYKIAQYGQWDGYPSGQGITVLRFLQSMDREKLAAGMAYTYFPTEEQIEQMYLDVGADPERLKNGMVDWDVSKKFGSRNPSLSRDTGAGVLDLVQSATGPIPMRNSIDFAADSLFCEWAYVIDLDKNTFEVFRGFNEEPLQEGERFYGAKCEKSNEYHPIKLAHTFHLDALPSEDEFLAVCEPQEEDA